MLLIVEANFPHGNTNQEQKPNLGSVASSVWNFCACFSDVILQGKQWWCHEKLAVFSGYHWNSDAPFKETECKLFGE
ncbi:MAG: hypothetical protein MI923_23155, partial [Phycisphaerales bacterium]|nr:hypothetical protein [Phycisphaerales bacterium]